MNENLLPIERLNKIKEILKEKKQIDVYSLSNILNVTEVTVRRDLEKLEDEKFLTRTHGGAVLNEKEIIRPIIFDDDKDKHGLYTPISKIASYFVKDHNVVFLGPGKTSRYIVRMFSTKKAVTVVTNDFIVAYDCSLYSPNVKVIIPSGELDIVNYTIYGRLTDSFLKSFYFDVAFFDVDGVSLDRGYSVSSMDKAYLIQDVMKISKENIAVCEYTRFSSNASSYLGPINLFQKIISTEHTPVEYKEYYFKNQMQFFGTFDAYRR